MDLSRGWLSLGFVPSVHYVRLGWVDPDKRLDDYLGVVSVFALAL